MKKVVLLSTMAILALCLMAGTALAWTYQYDCNDWPTLVDWILVTGFEDDFSVVQDPDDPANNWLHITSVDGADVASDDGDKTRYSRSRPQVRMDYVWDPKPDPDLGLTAEMRIRETAGGIFLEVYDGYREMSMETKPPYTFFELRGLSTDSIFLEDWNVLRLTMGPDGWMLYANGALEIDGTGQENVMPESKVAEEWNGQPFWNFIRFGHSGGSGPDDGSPADIWVDYIYFDTTGVYAPGEEPWTAVEGESWGKIKALF